ncbi:hypothetical protein ACFXKX_01380 [Streptomyces scopuliridis]|uniref:hypothetical protein n=1 Tax=Streptomyces scopuliridis TaxID=452529 RepID=UPI00369AD6D9
MTTEGTSGALAPLSEDLSPDSRALAESLRDLFYGLGISVRRYAARRHLNPGALSRYLNGTRTPPWDFVADLIANRNQHGTPVTVEVERLLQQLHDKALRPNRAAHKLQQMQTQLAEADAAVSRGESHKQALASMLEDRERELRDLRQRIRRLEHEREDDRQSHETALATWQDEFRQLTGERDELEAAVDRLREQLADAREEVTRAEGRCVLLEQQLEEAEARLGPPALEMALVEALEATNRMASVPQLVQLVTRLDTPGQEKTATELVTSAGRIRPVTEAAALIAALHAAGRQHHAEAALPAIVMTRSAEDVVCLVASFARAGLEDCVVTVLQTALKIHAPDQLARIGAGLSGQGLEEQTKALLGSMAVTHAVVDAVETLLTLDHLGFRETVEEALRDGARKGPVWELAELFGALCASERHDLAQALPDTVALERAATDVVGLFIALCDRDLSHSAHQMLRTSMSNRTTAHAASLISALRVPGTGSSRLLIDEALTYWPVRGVAVLVQDLVDTGEWAYAMSAVGSAVRHRPPAEFAELITVIESYEGDLTVLLTSFVSSQGPGDTARLVLALYDGGFFDYSAFAFWEALRGRSAGHSGEVVGFLEYLRGSQVSLAHLESHLEPAPDPESDPEPASEPESRTQSLRDIALLGQALHLARLPALSRTALLTAGVRLAAGEFAELLAQLVSVAPHLATALLQDVAREADIGRKFEILVAMEESPFIDALHPKFFLKVAGSDTKLLTTMRNAHKKQLRRSAEERAREKIRDERSDRFEDYKRTLRNLTPRRAKGTHRKVERELEFLE